MSTFLVTRRLGIDAGHRIASHGSKCRHLHGHRYEIEATCTATHLHPEGEQAGMVLDFGFLKEAMVAEIDVPCDHGFIAHAADIPLLRLFAPVPATADAWIATLQARVGHEGWALTEDTALSTQLYLIPDPPTAEALARHWFGRLAPQVSRRSHGLARLTRVRVWETPNNWAEYSEEEGRDPL